MTQPYANRRDFMRHARHSPEDLPALIVTVAITGGVEGKEANPALPETPAEQARSTHEAWQAGAWVVHVHARRPNNPRTMSHGTGRYLEVNVAIRERCPDIVVNNTMTGDVLGGHVRVGLAGREPAPATGSRE